MSCINCIAKASPCSLVRDHSATLLLEHEIPVIQGSSPKMASQQVLSAKVTAMHLAMQQNRSVQAEYEHSLRMLRIIHSEWSEDMYKLEDCMNSAVNIISALARYSDELESEIGRF